MCEQYAIQQAFNDTIATFFLHRNGAEQRDTDSVLQLNPAYYG